MKSGSPNVPVTVVGVGASAGGLAALKSFFAGVPGDTGLAFVVVVHLSPDHESHLADILQPSVNMPVEQVAATLPLEPNRVYLIPPNANLEAIDTHLRLSELEARRQERAPVDHFFRTLAQTHDGHAVGIILSGTGSDGTLGIKAIKEQGGLTVVQSPDEAEYDGMPQSAIATGLVDLVLPVKAIPGAVLRFAGTQPQLPVADDETQVDDEARGLLQTIFAQMRARTGRDFTRYKRSTILRRIARRMQLHQVQELEAYLDLLSAKPEEIQALADELLITVTNFFRDGAVFESLERDVLPRIFARKSAQDSEVRAWVVGCATGEEAYSLAILLLEEASRHDAPPRIQVFATDLHEQSLERARQGFYPGDIEADVSPGRLRRFFLEENGGYRVRKEVREVVVFAPHNLLGDPPFSRLDLITCRNVLIYLQREAQEEVDELFHYALRPDGFLLLGGSEAISRRELFVADGKNTSVYRKRDVPTPEPRLPVFPFSRGWDHTRDGAAALSGPQTSYGQLHQRLLERFAPPSVLVSLDDRVVHLSEHAGRYLVHPGGEPTASVFRLVREELRLDLHVAISEARRGRRARSRPIRVRFNGDQHPVVLHARPCPDPSETGLVLVIFDELDDAEQSAAESSRGEDGRASVRERELGAELDIARQKLQAVIAEYEDSQEEMKASNEELQSANEELRSTMEELETGKEELHSMNEELQTVNQENRHKVEELSQLSGDLQNLLASTEIATLFLDRELRILRFTPKVGELFNVRLTDRGRPLADLTHRLGYSELHDDAKAVLDRLIPVEREVRDEAGRWYLARVLPYRSTTDRIDGIVVTFVETTALKRAEAALSESEKRASEELAGMVRLHELVGRLLVSPDLDTALLEVLDATLSITRAEMGTIHLHVGDGQLETTAHRGVAAEFLEEIGTVHPGDPTARAYETGKRVVVEDIVTEAACAESAITAGYRGVQATPLVSRSRELLGVLTTYHAKPYRPSPRDLRILDLYARQATDFIERVASADALNQKTRQLEEEDERKGLFMATLGHELRNPLAVLDNVVHALKLAGPQERAPRESKLLPMALAQVNQLKRLVDDMLEITRMTRGAIVLRKTRADLAEIVRTAAGNFAEDLHERAQELVLSVPETLPVYGDEARMLQVLANLLGNASKYSPRRSRIEVSLREEGDAAVIAVRDEGKGLERHDFVRIFEPFIQMDPGTGGLGIGLPLVKRIAELHGGTATVESPGPGRGSTFTIRIPIGDLSRAPARAEEAHGPDLPASTRVLIVEDGRDTADSLAIRLRTRGAEVRCAYSGAEGIDQSARWTPSLILVDIGLPDMTGFEVARRIREHGSRALLVAVTGFSDDTTEDRAKEAGFVTRLVKPIDFEALQELIAQHVETTRAAADR